MVTLRNNDCLFVESTFGYSPPDSLSEDAKIQEAEIFDKIMATFKFID